jgi:hypothetical protein
MPKTSAKQSAVDTLHRLFVAELTLRLQAGDATAAVLNTIGTFLAKSGIKATDDSPKMRQLAKAYDSLPFTTADENSLPTTKGATPQTNEKAKH